MTTSILFPLALALHPLTLPAFLGADPILIGQTSVATASSYAPERGAASVPSSHTQALRPPLTFGQLPWPWSCIAFQESTDNTQAVNPLSGDQGAFQFSLPTWDEYAPTDYPREPIFASLQEQFDVALLLWQARGFEPWVTASECGA